MASLRVAAVSRSVLGGLSVVPFLVLNAVIAGRIEPVFSYIRPGINTSALELALLATVVALMPLGSLVALRPMLARRSDKLRLYVVDVVVAGLIFGVFLWLAVGIGTEIYRCDVLRIPNCD